jgi:hypothetical protein
MPVGDPSNELVVLVDHGQTLVVGGGEGLDGVLERVGSAEARHVTRERSDGVDVRSVANPLDDLVQRLVGRQRPGRSAHRFSDRDLGHSTASSYSSSSDCGARPWPRRDCSARYATPRGS